MYVKAAEGLYYQDDNKDDILEKLISETSFNIKDINHELLYIFHYILNTEPPCYWNKTIFKTTYSNLQRLLDENQTITIDEQIFELFLAGYSAYTQVTETIVDLSNVNYNPSIRNRQYLIPTYISIVEGCLTNLYRFIILLIDQTVDKDYASNYKLKPICDILDKNGYNVLTEKINIDIRNAINHGGILFKENGDIIDFHYNQKGKSVLISLKAYNFEKLLLDVYDVASSVILGISTFLNNNWNIINIDRSANSFSAFSLLGMKLSIPEVKCYYISESMNVTQLNAEFWISNPDTNNMLILAVELAILIYSQYSNYDKYYISFRNERLAPSWMRFTKRQISDIINRKREVQEIRSEVIQKDALLFPPSTEELNVQEIKYFRFPNYQCDKYKIRQIKDLSVLDRKRIKCNLYIGDITDKEEILQIIKNSINWVKKLKNVDSLTLHQKNGDMEADSVYMNVYRYDRRNDKEISSNNNNFICFVDYNLSGETTLLNGGILKIIWDKLYHEKIDKMFIAWREKRFLMRHIKKIGVNDKCPCGSGEKFKKCCKGKGIYD